MLALAAGAAIVSFTGPIVRLLVVPPTVTAFYRMVFGGAILLVIVLVARERLRLDRQSLLLAAAAALAFAFDMTMWNRSIRLVGPGLATILVGCQVFPMAGIGFVFGREKLTWRLGVAVPLAIIGLAMIVGVDWRLSSPGFRLGVARSVLGAHSATRRTWLPCAGCSAAPASAAESRTWQPCRCAAPRFSESSR
jgi:drug/metabolite transporter (DMT)-like permease